MSAKRKTIHPENQPKEVFDVSILDNARNGEIPRSNVVLFTLPLFSAIDVLGG